MDVNNVQSLDLAAKTYSDHPISLNTRAVTDDSGCPSTNGTTFISAACATYQTICNINIPGQDLPFQSVATFTDCVAQCDFINSQAKENDCVAAIFTPGRINDANDCDLKYAANDATTVTGSVEGAILIPNAVTLVTTGTTSISSGPTVSYASGTKVVVPTIAYSQLHGPAQNYPTPQYFKLPLPPDLTLTANLLYVGVEGDLSIDYPISRDTGILPLNATMQPLLTELTDTRHLSRDGGKGGLINGEHLFVFCDTGSYSTTTDNTNSNFLAFVSSSVATDVGMYALHGNPIHLQDGI